MVFCFDMTSCSIVESNHEDGGKMLLLLMDTSISEKHAGSVSRDNMVSQLSKTYNMNICCSSS